MNLQLGLWRTGMVLNGMVCLITLAMYGAIEAPSKPSLEWATTDRLLDQIYADQTPDFRASTSRYSIKGQVWPNNTNAEIIQQLCNQSSSPELKKICADFKEEVSWLWWSWIKHAIATLFFTFVAGTVAGLLWWCFSWVILGFAHPKDPPPNS